MIPTLLVFGAVAGLFRRGWLFVPVAAVGWPTILILGDVDSGVSFFIGAAVVGALNAAAGVAVGAGTFGSWFEDWAAGKRSIHRPQLDLRLGAVPNPSRTGNMRCLGRRGLWLANCCMPQRVRMFLEGLVRQPGDAISMVTTPVRRLVLNQGELMRPEPATS